MHDSEDCGMHAIVAGYMYLVFITPRACARGKVIGRVVVVVHKKSPDLGI